MDVKVTQIAINRFLGELPSKYSITVDQLRNDLTEITRTVYYCDCPLAIKIISDITHCNSEPTFEQLLKGLVELVYKEFPLHSVAQKPKKIVKVKCVKKRKKAMTKYIHVHKPYENVIYPPVRERIMLVGADRKEITSFHGDKKD